MIKINKERNILIRDFNLYEAKLYTADLINKEQLKNILEINNMSDSELKKLVDIYKALLVLEMH